MLLYHLHSFFSVGFEAEFLHNLSFTHTPTHSIHVPNIYFLFYQEMIFKDSDFFFPSRTQPCRHWLEKMSKRCTVQFMRDNYL
ncbi:hypothetical protein ACB092_04G215800 [Castanea dentata]